MESHLERIAAQGAKLAVFPEAMVTGYCFDSVAEAMPYAEPVPGESVDRLAPLCRRLDMAAVYGTLEREGDLIYNVAMLVGPDGLVSAHRKMHLPRIGIDRFAAPGDRPFEVNEVFGLRVGMLVCYDGGFPEAVRCLALAGADLVALPTNWPHGAECAAEHATNCRAWENEIYFAAANRVGNERGYQFIGRSRICDPLGRTLADAPDDRSAVLLAEIDPAFARDKGRARNHIINRIADRRPQMYGLVAATGMVNSAGE
jgi:predicted amidohydrolase